MSKKEFDIKKEMRRNNALLRLYVMKYKIIDWHELKNDPEYKLELAKTISFQAFLIERELTKAIMMTWFYKLAVKAVKYLAKVLKKYEK